MKSGRAPSYRAIAEAILKNDVSLKNLGFEGKYTQWSRILKIKYEGRGEFEQLKLF